MSETSENKTTPSFEENLKLALDGIACVNSKPISCFTGTAPGAIIEGMTVAEVVAEPVRGASEALKMFARLQEDAGPVRAFNSAPRPMNAVLIITLLWNSRVLIPGIDLPDDSVWQVKEEELISREDYDEIMAMGYTNFVQSRIMPRIVDLDYMAKYLKIAADATPEFNAMIQALNIPIFNGVPTTPVPFEQLCGMRSMTQFYMDCYKIPEKLKEVSEFVYAERYAQNEAALEALDNPIALGGWVGGWRTASAMVNPQIWEDLVWPYMKASAEQVAKHGKIATMHLDSSWDRDIERFGELPEGQFILNTDGMTDLPRARRLLPKAALMGDVPPTLLTTGTPQQVSDYVKRLIDEVGPQGLFICPGCDTPINATYDNLVAMVKTTNEWS